MKIEKTYLYILFTFFLLLGSCSRNFYSEKYNDKKQGNIYYEIKKDTVNNITEIKKYKKGLFSKKRKIKKYIGIDKTGAVRIIKFRNRQMNGWEIKYDADGNKSRGNKFKNGKIIVLKTPRFW